MSLFSDTRLRFFPNGKSTSSEIDKANTAYLTVYYEEKNSLEDVLDRIVECVHPNYKILIGLKTTYNAYWNLKIVFFRFLVFNVIWN